MQHDGHALAADETDHEHHRPPGVASVHTRAIVTWVAIFPLAAIGMTLMGHFASSWPAALKALALTAVVVPATVYVTVPRLLALVLAHSHRGHRRRITAAARAGTHRPSNLPTASEVPEGSSSAVS